MTATRGESLSRFPRCRGSLGRSPRERCVYVRSGNITDKGGSDNFVYASRAKYPELVANVHPLAIRVAPWCDLDCAAHDTLGSSQGKVTKPDFGADAEIHLKPPTRGTVTTTLSHAGPLVSTDWNQERQPE